VLWRIGSSSTTARSRIIRRGTEHLERRSADVAGVEVRTRRHCGSKRPGPKQPLEILRTITASIPASLARHVVDPGGAELIQVRVQ